MFGILPAIQTQGKTFGIAADIVIQIKTIAAANIFFPFRPVRLRAKSGNAADQQVITSGQRDGFHTQNIENVFAVPVSDDYVMIGKFITAAKHPQFGKHQIAPFAVAAIISITAGFRIQFDVSNQIPIGIYPIIFIFQGYGTVVFAVTGFNTGKVLSQVARNS